VTRGFICSKGQKHLRRLYDPYRLQTPLLRRGDDWQPVSWDTAYQVMARRLGDIAARDGSRAILHHDTSGHNGLLRGLAARFFNALGGATVPWGSLCWGSGYAAQQLDFGALYAHSWEDLRNAGTIVLWGRDPSRTNLHLLPFLREATQQGAVLMVINPAYVELPVPVRLQASPRPGTDGALALGMAAVIIRDNLVNPYFIANHTTGFDRFKELAGEFTPDRVEALTGVPARVVESLAHTYAGNGPSAILLGYGLQRYVNGGTTVRAIDALAALTGNIGVPGGGANYVSQHWRGFFNDVTGAELGRRRRLSWPRLGRAILEADSPPVRSIVVTRSNPVTQLPDTNAVLEAFRRAEFVVVADQFMTDTAGLAHLVLPCTHFLEDDDLVYSSWSNYLFLANQAVPPPGQCKPDYRIFSELAEIMGLPGFPRLTPHQWLAWALEPATAKYGITLEQLRQGPVRHPEMGPVAWADKKFKTPSGKFEFFNGSYVSPGYLTTPGYPLCLITPHHRDYLHSQYYNLDREQWSSLPEVDLHPATAGALGINHGDTVAVVSPAGRIRAAARVTGAVSPYMARIFQGKWIQQQGGVNFLTLGQEPDLGLGTPYYDCPCRVEKI
jgi:anaerobic selenocysteine-containing dehydrogenase